MEESDRTAPVCPSELKSTKSQRTTINPLLGSFQPPSHAILSQSQSQSQTQSQSQSQWQSLSNIGLSTPCYHQQQVQEFKEYSCNIAAVLSKVNLNQLEELKNKYRFYLSKVEKLEKSKEALQEKERRLAEIVESSTLVREEIDSINFIMMISKDTENRLVKLVEKVSSAKEQKRKYKKQVQELRQIIKKEKDQYFALKRKQLELRNDQQKELETLKQQQAENMFRSVINDKIQRMSKSRSKSKSMGRSRSRSRGRDTAESIKENKQEKMEKMDKQDMVETMKQFYVGKSEAAGHHRTMTSHGNPAIQKSNSFQVIGRVDNKYELLPQLSKKKIGPSQRTQKCEWRQSLILSLNGQLQTATHKKHHDAEKQHSAGQQVSNTGMKMGKMKQKMVRNESEIPAAEVQKKKGEWMGNGNIDGDRKNGQWQKPHEIITQLNRVHLMKQQLLRYTQKLPSGSAVNARQQPAVMTNAKVQIKDKDNKYGHQLKETVQKECQACEHREQKQRILKQKYSLHKEQPDQTSSPHATQEGQLENRQDSLLLGNTTLHRIQDRTRERAAFLQLQPEQVVRRIVECGKIVQVIRLMQQQSSACLAKPKSEIRLLR